MLSPSRDNVSSGAARVRTMRKLPSSAVLRPSLPERKASMVNAASVVTSLARYAARLCRGPPSSVEVNKSVSSSSSSSRATHNPRANNGGWRRP